MADIDWSEETGHLFVDGVALEDPDGPAVFETEILKPPFDGVAAVLFGWGSGRFARDLLAAGYTKVIAYEPIPEVMRRFAPSAEALPPETSLTCAAGDWPRTLRGALSYDGVTAFVPPFYLLRFPEEYGAWLEQTLEHVTAAASSWLTFKSRGDAFVDAQIGNLWAPARYPYSAAVGKPLTGHPAFVVSAGPSLDRNIHLLREAQTRGPLFVVNTAAPAVARHVDRIDVVATLETSDVSGHMRDLADRIDVLVPAQMSHRSVWELPTALKLGVLFGDEAEQWIAAKLGLEPIPSGPSVACSTTALALKLGADPVVILGQDCAYTDWKPYVGGSGNAHKEVVRGPGWLAVGGRKMAVKEIPAWGGGTVFSPSDLRAFAQWFGHFGALAKEKARLINATEGGAHLDHWEEIPLADVLAGLPAWKHGLKEVVAAAAPVDPAAVRAAIESARTVYLEIQEKLVEYRAAADNDRKASIAESLPMEGPPGSFALLHSVQAVVADGCTTDSIIDRVGVAVVALLGALDHAEARVW